MVEGRPRHNAGVTQWVRQQLDWVRSGEQKQAQEFALFKNN